MSVVLAIDAGTTGNRVMAFDGDGRVVAKAYYEFPQIFPKPGWVEHDPEQIWQTTQRALSEVLEAVSGQKIVALGITNQRETAIIWNRHTGKPIANAIVWQCRRTTPECRSLQSHAKSIKEKTGLFLDPYFSATKIRWLLDHVDGAREAAQKGDLVFGTVDTWLLWKLTGGRVHATEPSNASRTLLYNLASRDYDDDLLKLFGVPRSMLPEVRSSGGHFATTDAELAGCEIPIMGILGDQQASLFAQGGWKPDVVKNTYGTGLFVMTSTGDQIPRSERLVGTVAWELEDTVTYALEASIFVGGSCLQWLRDGLKLFKQASESQSLAESLPGNEGVYFVPALAGLGAPYWDPSARGLLIGLTRGTRIEHLARAALEAMAFQTLDAVEVMEQDTQKKLQVLRVDGGAVANDFLMQFQADVLGVPVERPRMTETTVWGAAAIAGIASGFWSASDWDRLNTIEKTFEPQMNEADRKRLHSEWRRAIERSLNWDQPDK